ncbi:MAG TPA: helix-turn-helix domain-containing protein, partial [Anaerolineales bacterium]|nr:helix-turn-helix domain-containing protein [Anaerolineales bacterium]
KVRDPAKQGIPEWDFRYVLKPLPGRADIHTNYAERKCKTPMNINLGISPLWPYVAESGGYELPNGQLRPPIIVDWEKGKVTHFSELVTVRNQNCSYALYLLNGIDPGKTSQPDFESPFAFYDLSGQGKGFPNLVLRTERYPVGDPWSTGLDLEAQAGRPVPRDIETVRYSWRNTVGDRLWDYKVEVLGFYPYTFDTSIAGGLFSIDVPPYEKFPKWVIGHSWPAVTFIDTEGHSYSSNEGIYDWSPREIGIGYILGWEEESKLQAFSKIANGFRGEYRFRKNVPPSLYLSPIDNQLHLLWGEGGLWDLGEGLVLKLGNLDGGRYINSWVRERVPVQSTRQPVDAQPAVAGEAEESLYALAGYLIYSGRAGTELRQAEYPPSRFEILPPTDKASWQLFQERLGPYTEERRDPKDLRSWLSPFSGKTLTIAGGQISDVRVMPNGFRFILDLRPGYRVQENELFDAFAFEPGHYVVTYNGHFTIEPLTPPAISVSLINPIVHQLELNPIQVTFRNDGLEDIPQATLELSATSSDGTTRVVANKTVQLLAKKSVTTTLVWAPASSGTWILTPKIQEPNGRSIAGDPVSIVIAHSKTANLRNLLLVSTSPRRLPVILLGLIILATLTASVFWHEWGQPLANKVNDEAKDMNPKQNEIRSRCPSCQAQEKQSKAGFNHSGSQRHRCGQCKRVYTPNPKFNGYSRETRMLALRMHEDGNSYQVIGRVLKVSPRSVVNWVKRYKANSSTAPRKPGIAELAGSYSFSDYERKSAS